jgi:hypothetical protein
MTIIDANLLLYAYNAEEPRQRMAAQWLAKLIASSDSLGIHPRKHQFTTLDQSEIRAEAFAIVGEWLAQPGVVSLHPGPLHAEILEELVSEYGATGPLVTDAVLAALAIEYGATLASTDQDFRRFPTLRWVNPLEG